MTRIAIDLNVRVRGFQTFAGFEDVEGGELPHVDEWVEVFEPESDVHGKGLVTEVDAERRLIYVDVDWTGLANPWMPAVQAISGSNFRSFADVVAARATAAGLGSHTFHG